ncbi:MAG: hypothetical protein WCG81_02810 [Candidatus Angelobacter sp.]
MTGSAMLKHSSVPANGFATLQTINLFFHGPFAFIVDTSIQRVRVVTPVNHDHAFCWYGNSFRAMKPFPMDNFELDPAGLNPGTAPNPDPAQNIVIPAAACGFSTSTAGTMPTGEGSIVAISLKLPYPSVPPTPLRPAQNGQPAGSALNFRGPNANKIVTKQFPLVYKFTYSVQNPAAVALKSNPNDGLPDWNPAMENPNADHADLHIFAEPPCGVDASHAATVFSDLVGLIDESVAFMVSRPDPTNGLPGLPTVTSETMTLEETLRKLGLCPSSSPNAGVRIVNCMGLFVV